jgi:hypothetical protein
MLNPLLPFHQDLIAIANLTSLSQFSQHLLLEDKPSKGPFVKLPTRIKLLPLKHNETLGVKTNKKGEIVCAKYNTGERTYFEGVRAHPKIMVSLG